MFSRVILFFTLLYLFTVNIYAAQIPQSEQEIPIYPNAVRNEYYEADLRLERPSEGNTRFGIRSNSLKIYTTTDSAEEVFKYYREKLGGTEGIPEEEINFPDVNPGTILPVRFNIQFYEKSWFEDLRDDDGKIIRAGKWVKSALLTRAPYSNGQWILAARFEWGKKEVNGDYTQFAVSLEDDSFDLFENTYKTRTNIIIDIITYKAEEALDMENNELLDEAILNKTRELENNPPTEKELGVPLYPGAVFDAENSAGMSIDDECAYYVYLSEDPVAKVVNFYEEKTKKKAVSLENELYMIPLKGTMPVPYEGIVIQPNVIFSGKAKTVITIQKHLG